MQEELKIKTFDGTFNAYVSLPEVTPAPVVIVLQEIFGVNAGVRQIADEFAKDGFIAIAPDLFWRTEPGMQLSAEKESDWKKALDYYKNYGYDAGMKDMAAIIEAARKLPGSNGKVGVVGFCFGGLMTYLTAVRLKPDAAASYYGSQTEKYISEGSKSKTPLIVHLAGEDEFMDKSAQAAISKELSGNAHIKVYIYPGCNHAFARPNGDHYSKQDAETAHARTLALFNQHLN